MKEERELTVGISFLRELFHLTDQRICQLAEEGIMVKVARGRYNVWKSVKGYVKFLQERRSIDSGSAEADTYQAHKTRLCKGQADIVERKAAAIKGEFHEGGCVSEVMNDGITAMRSRLLALPTSVAPRVMDVGEVNGCVKLLTEHIEEALSELSEYDGRSVVKRYLKQELKQEKEREERDEKAYR